VSNSNWIDNSTPLFFPLSIMRTFFHSSTYRRYFPLLMFRLLFSRFIGYEGEQRRSLMELAMALTYFGRRAMLVTCSWHNAFPSFFFPLPLIFIRVGLLIGWSCQKSRRPFA
jgi:hypothetical protein